MEIGEGKGQGTMKWGNFFLWKQQNVKCLTKDDRGVTQVTKYNGLASVQCQCSLISDGDRLTMVYCEEKKTIGSWCLGRQTT